MLNEKVTYFLRHKPKMVNSSQIFAVILTFGQDCVWRRWLPPYNHELCFSLFLAPTLHRIFSWLPSIGVSANFGAPHDASRLSPVLCLLTLLSFGSVRSALVSWEDRPCRVPNPQNPMSCCSIRVLQWQFHQIIRTYKQCYLRLF